MSKSVTMQCDNCGLLEIGPQFNMTNGARITVYGDFPGVQTFHLDLCPDCIQTGILLSVQAALSSNSIIKIAKGVAQNESN